MTRNIARDSGKSKIYLRDLGFDCYLEAGFAKILARGAVLGKKTVFIRRSGSSGCGIVVKKRAGMPDQDAPFRPCKYKLHGRLIIRKRFLTKGDFSSAVSHFSQVFIMISAKSFVARRCRESEASSRAREKSFGTNGNSLLLSHPILRLCLEARLSAKSLI